jgi:colanic acid/amylovoran biosynthesis glycosyltransferase
MNRLRILLYTEEFLSPSMTFVARQINSLQSRFDVSVLARTRSNAELFTFEPVNIVPINGLEQIGSRFRRLTNGRDWEISRGASGDFHAAISRCKPDLIHAHFGPSGLAILPFAIKQRIPLLTTFHGFDASSYLKRSIYKRDLAHLFDYSEIVTVSRSMRQSLIQLGANPARTHCRYIGVPITSFVMPIRRSIAEKVARKEKIRFLQVSNFVEKKGHEFTVHAFAELTRSFPTCELLFVGSGPLVPKVMELVGELNLEEQVRILKHQDSNTVAALMRDADCFVHHSVTSANGDMEGIPTVLMEAMACGLPVISTKHSGIPELFDNGLDGLLVNERDIGQYVEAMYTVLNDHGQLGSRARLKVEQMFDIAACSLELGDLYDAIINVESRVASSGFAGTLS